MDVEVEFVGCDGVVQREPIALPDTGPPYAAVIDHVLACLTGHAGNLIEPASALPTLQLTLDVHQRLTQAAS